MPAGRIIMKEGEIGDSMPGIKMLRKIGAALRNRIRKDSQDVLKLSTTLSVALSK